MSATLGTTSFEGVPDTDRTQAYYVIKAAQDKEQLQQEGDVLNNDIQRIEKEILVLTNTLEVIDGRNENLRQTFNAADENCPESIQKTQVEEQMTKITNKLKAVKRDGAELAIEVKALTDRMHDISLTKNQLGDTIATLQATRQQVSKDLQSHYSRVERANTLISKFLHDIRRKHNQPVERPQTVPVQQVRPMTGPALPATPMSSRADTLTDEELEVVYLERKQANKYVLTALNGLSETHPDVGAVLKQLSAELGLVIPTNISRPPTVGSPRPVSVKNVRK